MRSAVSSIVMKPNQQWKSFRGVTVVPQGEKWLKMSVSGEVSEVVGPTYITSLGGTKLLPLKFHTASDNEYLSVKTLLGEKICIPGPSHIYENPMLHDSVNVIKAIELLANEALVVYCPQETEISSKETKRKIIYGPCVYVPRSGSEYFHNFEWHGAPQGLPSDEIHVKVPRALKFTKLRTIPDQLYLDGEFNI